MPPKSSQPQPHSRILACTVLTLEHVVTIMLLASWSLGFTLSPSLSCQKLAVSEEFLAGHQESTRKQKHSHGSSHFLLCQVQSKGQPCPFWLQQQHPQSS